MAASVPVPSVSLAWLQSGRVLWALSWSPTVVHSLEFQLLPCDPRPQGPVQTWPCRAWLRSLQSCCSRASASVAQPHGSFQVCSRTFQRGGTCRFSPSLCHATGAHQKVRLPDNRLPGCLYLCPVPPCILSLLGPWAAGPTLGRTCLRQSGLHSSCWLLQCGSLWRKFCL